MNLDHSEARKNSPPFRTQAAMFLINFSQFPWPSMLNIMESMHATPRVTNPSHISLGGFGIGISLALQPRDIPTTMPPYDISYAFITLGESCYIVVG